MADFAPDPQVPADTLVGRDYASRLAHLAADEDERFNHLALDAYRRQTEGGQVYGAFVRALDRPEPVSWTEIPPLPVAAFKGETPVCTFPPDEAEAVFESSGTGEGVPARHFVRDVSLYHQLSALHFARVFGEGPFSLVAHLPGYSDRAERSSLIRMVEHLIQRFGDDSSGFFLDDVGVLYRAAEAAQENGHTLILFGAAFGLLDLCDQGRPASMPPDAWVIETGGMKTRRREIDRKSLHGRLAAGFGLDAVRIRSEYGMCELMSQAYTHRGGLFYPPAWMRCRVVHPDDPFREVDRGKSGVLAVCDLANVHTVSMLLTEDVAVAHETGFEVLGRLAGAALRGCNALLEPIR